jgi:hypothetical protein
VGAANDELLVLGCSPLAAFYFAAWYTQVKRAAEVKKPQPLF